MEVESSSLVGAVEEGVMDGEGDGDSSVMSGDGGSERG